MSFLKELWRSRFSDRDSRAAHLLGEFDFHIHHLRRLKAALTTFFKTLAAMNKFSLVHLFTSRPRVNRSYWPNNRADLDFAILLTHHTPAGLYPL
jgi:hypothetical protein